jgi:hypothetical protein
MRHLSATATTIVAALLPLAAFSSSHREAPNITRLPTVDSTDVYSFMSYEPGREEYVTLLANYLPLQDPYGGPNYFALDPSAVYEIHIDNDGDARENLTFQFRFDNDLGGNRARGLKVPVGPAGKEQNIAVPLKNIGGVAANSDNAQTLNFRESYTLTLVRGDRRRGDDSSVRNASNGDKTFGKPYDFVGTKTFGSIDGYNSYANQFIYTVDIPGCSKQGRVFVGQRNEPFAGQPRSGVRSDQLRADRRRQRAGRRRRQGLSGRHHAERRQRHHLRQEHHDARARSAQELPGRLRQRRDRRVDLGQPAAGSRAESARDVRGARCERRRAHAGLAPRHAARE